MVKSREIGFLASNEFYAKLSQYAKDNDVPMSVVIRDAIGEFYKSHPSYQTPRSKCFANWQYLNNKMDGVMWCPGVYCKYRDECFPSKVR